MDETNWERVDVVTTVTSSVYVDSERSEIREGVDVSVDLNLGYFTDGMESVGVRLACLGLDTVKARLQSLTEADIAEVIEYEDEDEDEN